MFKSRSLMSSAITRATSLSWSGLGPCLECLEPCSEAGLSLELGLVFHAGLGFGQCLGLETSLETGPSLHIDPKVA